MNVLTKTGILGRMKTQKKIVILGAGFGGYQAYKTLPDWVHRNHSVTVIDKKNHFLFTPLLPEVAGASLDQHSIVAPLRNVLKKKTRFINKEVRSVDVGKQIVTLKDEVISYDYLISSGAVLSSERSTVSSYAKTPIS